MKKAALFTTIMFAALVAASNAAVACAVDTSIAFETDRQFAEQDFTLHKGATGVGDGTLTCDAAEHWKVYGTYWQAQTDVTTNNEIDLVFGGVYQAGEHTTIDGNLAMFEIAGPEAYRARITVGHQINDNWSVSVNGDIVRGGFETEVVRGQVFYTHPLAGPFSYNLRAGVSYDSWSGDTVAQWGAGVSTPFVLGTTLSAYVQGYAGLTGGHDNLTGNDTMGGISLSRHFPLR